MPRPRAGYGECVNGTGMTANATTAVTALVNEARQRHGEVRAVEVPEPLLEQLMDEMVDAGGPVGFDSCEVDGVRIVAGGTEAGVPLAHPAGGGGPVPLATGD